MLRVFSLAVLLSGATCGGMSPASERTQQPELAFEVLGTMQTSGTDTVTIVETMSGEAILTGIITTPNPCYQLSATLGEGEDALTLTIQASALPRICPQVVAAFEYRARLYHLTQGEHLVRVTYRYPGTGWEGKNYDLRVEVPE